MSDDIDDDETQELALPGLAEDGGVGLDTDAAWHLPGPHQGPVPAHLEIIVDGREYLRRWRSLLETLTDTEGTVLHSAWRLSNVGIEDPENATSHKLYSLFRRHGSNRFFVRLSGHFGTLANSRPFLSLKARAWPGRAELYPYIDQSFGVTSAPTIRRARASSRRTTRR